MNVSNSTFPKKSTNAKVFVDYVAYQVQIFDNGIAEKVLQIYSV